MDTDDESASNPYLQPSSYTPGTNKRLRSEDESVSEIHKEITQQQKHPSTNENRNQEISSIQQNEFPPITLQFNAAHNYTDRKLIEELINQWKIKNRKSIDIIGRFGYGNVLLIFPRNTSALDDLLDRNKWPTKIFDIEFTTKQPKILPEMYSIVIRDFQYTWKDEETAIDLREKYPTLIKIARLMTRDGRPMNIARADFNSAQIVKQLLNRGEIEINCMKLYIRQYYAPIKINKCRKCFKHDHFTNQCTSPQLCFKCGQQHSLKEGCPNELKCVNCGQQHFPGHPACPVVQQIRKQLTEQHKVNRVQLLVNQQQQQQHRFNSQQSTNDFPPLMTNSNILSFNPRIDPSNTVGKTKHHLPYATVAAGKTSNRNEHAEQIRLSLSESINQQLANFIATIATQIANVDRKIDSYNQRLYKTSKSI